MKESLERIKTIDLEDVTLKRVLHAIIRRFRDIPHTILWYLPWGFAKLNRTRLRKYRNVHADKRCFIIANGPSLKKINFNLLKNEITFGMNRIYLMEEQNGFIPKYLACIDIKSQLLQFTDDFNKQKGICFYDWHSRHLFEKKKNFIFIKGKFSPKFSKDPVNDRLGNGRTVTYACLQLAYYMGFKEVYLIGKDHSYNTSAKAGLGIESTGNEGNHFIKGYYNKGQNWDAPDYKSEEFAYKLSREAFETNNRIIKDATINGRLEVFEKVNFSTLFEKE
jgi:hypothetical protein